MLCCGDNINPCPIDINISLDNKVETQFLLLSLKELKYLIEKSFRSSSWLKFCSFDFLEIDDFNGTLYNPRDLLIE